METTKAWWKAEKFHVGLNLGIEHYKPANFYNVERAVFAGNLCLKLTVSAELMAMAPIRHLAPFLELRTDGPSVKPDLVELDCILENLRLKTNTRHKSYEKSDLHTYCFEKNNTNCRTFLTRNFIQQIYKRKWINHMYKLIQDWLKFIDSLSFLDSSKNHTRSKAQKKRGMKLALSFPNCASFACALPILTRCHPTVKLPNYFSSPDVHRTNAASIGPKRSVQSHRWTSNRRPTDDQAFSSPTDEPRRSARRPIVYWLGKDSGHLARSWLGHKHDNFRAATLPNCQELITCLWDSYHIPHFS